MLNESCAKQYTLNTGGTADTWEELHRNRKKVAKYPSEHVVSFMARNYYASDRSAIRVLDLGCGAGANTWFLSNEGFDVYAVDISPTAVENTKVMLGIMGLTANVQVSDAAELPFQNEYFDVIINCMAICCNTVSVMEQIITECKRTLKKGGCFFSTEYDVRTPGFGTGVMIEDNTYRDMTEGPMVGVGAIHFFEKGALRKFYQSMGFELVSMNSVTMADQNEDMLIAYHILHARKP